jgi:hypothetical protein
LSRKATAAIAAVHLPSPFYYGYSYRKRHRFMGKGKNSRAASSKRVIKEDEEQTLEVIENKEFLAMRATASAWPVPVIREEQLKELVDEGLLQEKELADWKVLGEHRVLFLQPGEIVLFVAFVRVGLCPPASFLHHFLRFFAISLNHLTPNAVLHLSVFVHFCEAFLGILPFITLFCYFFRLKPHHKSNNTSVLGGCRIQFHQNK